MSRTNEENKYARQAREDARAFSEGLKQLGGKNKKLVAGITALFLGEFGVHKFVLGYQQEGVMMLLVTLLGAFLSIFGFGLTWVWLPWAIGIIEGIIYLTKSDTDFYETYQKGHRPWF